MYLLDTTHCIALLNNRQSVVDKLTTLKNTEVSTSLIVCGELVYGAYISEHVSENLKRVEELIKLIKVYGINWDTIYIYARLKSEIMDRFGPKDKRKRRNTKVESLGFKDNDLWIASTAIQHNLILVSADSDLLVLDGIQGLKVENW
jgi:tRNA(fMet)-specific endonuclease VapC